jgi:hypothetical protein
MQILSDFQLHRPATVDEAVQLRGELGDSAALYAGGTELLLAMKMGVLDYEHLIDVKRIDALRGIEVRDGSLWIGAGTTHRELETSTVVQERLPALATLERLTARTIAVALPALTLGIAAGLVRLEEDGGGLDALMAVTLLTWAVYGGFLLVRPTGRRAAQVALLGFALVIVARLGLPLTHFA